MPSRYNEASSADRAAASLRPLDTAWEQAGGRGSTLGHESSAASSKLSCSSPYIMLCMPEGEAGELAGRRYAHLVTMDGLELILADLGPSSTSGNNITGLAGYKKIRAHLSSSPVACPASFCILYRLHGHMQTVLCTKCAPLPSCPSPMLFWRLTAQIYGLIGHHPRKAIHHAPMTAPLLYCMVRRLTVPFNQALESHVPNSK